jgi:hypothetical protein
MLAIVPYLGARYSRQYGTAGIGEKSMILFRAAKSGLLRATSARVPARKTGPSCGERSHEAIQRSVELAARFAAA